MKQKKQTIHCKIAKDKTNQAATNEKAKSTFFKMIKEKIIIFSIDKNC